MLWFCSDLHMGHNSAIRMCERPFENVDLMNKELIRNINAVVKPNDTLYLLGDLCHRVGVEMGNELISKLNCKDQILVRGNHDKAWNPDLFTEICDFKEIHVGYKGQNYSISLMHYPMLSWPKSRYGSIHLHGHSHNKPEYNLQMKQEGIRRYDVGVDANGFCPVSLQQILSFMEI